MLSIDGVFEPAFDKPRTAEEAIAKLKCWGDPLCATFDAKHAKRMAELLAPSVGQRSADDPCMETGGWLSAALDDPADRAWRKWADDLRSAIGAREGWLTLTTHVRAREGSVCFSGTTLVPHQ